MLSHLITTLLALTGAVLAFAPQVLSFVPPQDSAVVSAILTLVAALHGTLVKSPLTPVIVNHATVSADLPALVVVPTVPETK